MQDNGFEVRMSEILHPHETQLTTQQANKSRLVTISRCVVEIVNGRFKRDFRLLRNIYHNVSLPNMGDYFKIAAALINAYHVLIEDSQYADDFLNIIRERFNIPNKLYEIVRIYNYNMRRQLFYQIPGNLPVLDNLPRLTEVDLILFGLGTYQLKQAKSYYGEHVREDGAFIIELADELPREHTRELGDNVCVIRGRIQSRHVKSKTYYEYIGFDVTQNGRHIIKEYYCTCKIGRRTVGCCGHVMCIAWYLTYARHEPFIRPPALGLENIFVRLDEE